MASPPPPAAAVAEEELDLSLSLAVGGGENQRCRRPVDGGTVLEAQEYQSRCRARDRAARERVLGAVPNTYKTVFPVQYATAGWPMMANVFGFQQYMMMMMMMMPCCWVSPAAYTWPGWLSMFPMPPAGANGLYAAGSYGKSAGGANVGTEGSSSSDVSNKDQTSSIQEWMSSSSTERSNSSQTLVEEQFNNAPDICSSPDTNQNPLCQRRSKELPQ